MTVTILDGGMGQELIHRSGATPTGLWATQVMIDRPDLVSAIHDDYFAAGAEIATTNTYAVQRDRFEHAGRDDDFALLQALACRLACEARDRQGRGKVAGSLGPLQFSYIADDGPPLAEAASTYREIAELQAEYVDLYIAETVTSLARARGVLEGSLGIGKPVWLAVSVDDHDGTRLRSGEAIEAVLDLLDSHPFDALLVNCSTPEAVSAALERLQGAPIPTGGYANGFVSIPDAYKKPGSTVELLTSRTDLGPDTYADFAARWIASGATIIGGCCEVGPAHIRELMSRFASGANT